MKRLLLTLRILFSFPNSRPDFGAYDSQIPTSTGPAMVQSLDISLGPDPASSLTVLDIQGDYTGKINLSCLDISG